MNNFTILNYQGSKNNLHSFIYKALEPYIKEGKAILDIFSGSGAISNMFRDNYQVFANDVECYASIIADSILNQPDLKNISDFLAYFENQYNKFCKQLAKPLLSYIHDEKKALENNNFDVLLELYADYPTVWNEKNSAITNAPLTVESIKNYNDYYLFVSYYASSYFGIEQSLEIDSIIKTIHAQKDEYQNALFSCLFFAMKECVFSKDGHMAQPLSLEKNQSRLFQQRNKHVYDLFIKKFKEYVNIPLSKFAGKNAIFNSNFEDLLNKDIFSNVGLVYADPPYTDMQYSRYYHLLNVAAKYEYPNLTTTNTGYTKGLYTEGRYQSKLSQRGFAKGQLEKLIQFCSKSKTNLALSYAYPENAQTQATDRYTISIDELISLAKKHFGDSQVSVVKQSYNHANHRNSAQKKVLEYLILCGEKNLDYINIESLKNELSLITPTKNNPMYNSHLYWSQKSFNICDALINALSNKGDVVFDPFLGSGVTTLEAISTELDRKAIGCDINDMPIFISKTLLLINKLDGLKDVLEVFISKIEPLNAYYTTHCPKCGHDGIISKVIFDKPDRKGTEINIKTINYTCNCSKKLTKSGSQEDLVIMNTIKPLNNIKNTSLLHNSKIAVAENDDIKNIFTGRNLSVLDKILSIIASYDSEYQLILKYILMSVLHLCKITDKHSNSQWPLWIPKTDCVEKNIIDIYVKKIRKFYEVIPFMKTHYANSKIVDTFSELEPGTCLLMQKGSQLITTTDIPNNSVDLIITDPPYLEQVLYSEYMQLYKPFLGLNYNLEDEIIVSSAPSRNKDKDDYFKLLEAVFQVCADKLKPNHYLCLYFHDCNLNVWSKLISILEKNCFRFVSQIHIDKTVTLKNIISPKKSLNGDSILLFIKDSSPIIHHASEEFSEIEHNIIRQSKYMVKSNKNMSTHELYDNGLMEVLIQNGWLHKLSEKYSSLVDIFEKHLAWNSSISRWEIKKTSD
ncbi:DNA methyltransferase [Pseudobacteroides cellulosolvens]|uniref:site-specific DNA-methyltransferase (adenine-specific) n=1 Tax=Pseudobacteroides cellulosolvens ATCC 35603 = DSM 2933 TaxID=398512 RepID=A0A0L6JX93_9FIRM|nr:DNA methyltransferase [Pseudobacteroides cellulosolvens]KNY30476.1 DNA methylase N-4/N-6 domain protein [Pseudobacteroides cellulosolvens ATCC 35603 = DSM 2933]